MGKRQVQQDALFYEFSLERHVPEAHLLRAIDRFVDLGRVRAHLAPFYSEIGRPSIDPELLLRMLIVGYWTPRNTGFERRLRCLAGPMIALPPCSTPRRAGFAGLDCALRGASCHAGAPRLRSQAIRVKL